MTVAECCMECGNECSCKAFGCYDVDKSLFYRFQGCQSPVGYFTYRLIMGAYAVTSLIYAVVFTPNPGTWPTFLTYWSYFLLAIYFLMHFIVVAEQRCRMEDEDGHGESTKLPWYLVMVWTLFEIMSPMAITVTLFYWITVFPSNNDPVGNSDILLHIMNTVVVLFEHSVTALPIRLLHVVYPLIFALVYIIFTVIYWTGDNTRVLYPALDWNEHTIAIAYVFAAAAVVVASHLMLFAIYKLRQSCCNGKNKVQMAY